MALKYANIDKLEENLTAVAEVIRTKSGKNDNIVFPAGYVNEIQNLYGAVDFGRSSCPAGDMSTDLLFINQYDHQSILTNCTQITSVTLTRSLFIPAGLCNGCTGLTFVQADKAQTIGNNAFNGCKALGPNLAFPSANGSNSNAFTNCSALEKLDYGGQGIGPWLTANSFSNCTKLSILVFRNLNKPYNLDNINVFNGTPFASGKAGGILYVPSDLINSYKEATNWSTILGYMKTDGETPQNQILSIENSEWVTKYVDGRLIADVNSTS